MARTHARELESAAKEAHIAHFATEYFTSKRIVTPTEEGGKGRRCLREIAQTKADQPGANRFGWPNGESERSSGFEYAKYLGGCNLHVSMNMS